MRRAVSVPLVGVLFLIISLPSASSQSVRDLPDLPGAFHPFNVTGDFAGKYHCVVTEHNLDPAVLLFVRGAEFSPQFKELLGKLDNAIAKNPAVRLGVFVVVYDDKELPNVVTDDDTREKLTADLRKQSDDLMLKNVVLTLASRSLPAANDDAPAGKLKKALPLGKQYDLKDDNAVTVILYKRFRVYARHDLGKDGLTEADVKEILGEVKTRFGARRE